MNFVLIIIGAVLSVIGYLVIRVLKNIDGNQSKLSESLGKLWESHDVLSKDFYRLSGEHHVNHFGERRHRVYD